MCWISLIIINGDGGCRLKQPIQADSQPKCILTIWSLFNPLAVPAPHLLSPFPAHRPSPHWKSQIDHSGANHPVSGINSLIHSVSLDSHVSTYLLIHLSAHLCHHHHSHLLLIISFTFSLQAQNLPFQQILPTLILRLWSAFPRDRTGFIVLHDIFLVYFFS